jgi:ABC-type transport system involved in multi-copper enzyme maturation permease subunit
VRDRIRVVAQATFLESVRDRVLLVVLVFAAALVLSSRVLGWLSIEDEQKMVMDASLTGISVLSLLLAMLVGAGALAREVERRTVYTVLSRDCGRGEFVLGKFAGLVAVFSCCIVAMTAVLAVWVIVWGGSVGEPLLAAMLGLLCEAVVLTSVALFLGALSAPTIASSGTLAFYVAARSTEALRDLTADGRNPAFAAVFKVLYAVLPNLENVNFVNATTSGRPVAWMDLGLGAVSAACWAAAFLAGAILLFRRRQF